MAHTEVHEVLSVEPEKLLDTVVRYEDYPKFVDGCNSIEVERKGPGHARVTYHLNIVRDITYTLDLREDREKGQVRWSLVEGDLFKKNEGGWDILPAGAGKSDVRYFVDVEFKVPVPGFILNRLVKGNLPSMLKSFEKQARSS